MGIGIRRGVRLAIALPLLLGILLLVLDDSAGIAFGMFLTTSILGTADFAGTARVRALACLATGLAAIPVIAIGLAASGSILAIIAVSLVVGGLLFYVGVLRGLVAAGAPVITAQFAVAVTSQATLSQLPSIIGGIGVAVALCIGCLLVVLPVDRRAHVRDGVADSLDAMAQLSRVAWGDLADTAAIDSATAAVDAAIEKVEVQFGGKPFRPAGVSRRDRALMDLIARLRLTRDAQQVLLRQARSSIPGTAELGANSAAALEHSARLLRDPRAPLPDLAAFPRLLDAHHTACCRWVTEQSGSAQDVVDELQRTHATRVVAGMCEQTAALSCAATGHAVNEQALGLSVRAPWWKSLLVNTSGRSPWVMSAVRGGVAIALGAAVAHLVVASMGLWVLFGVISVLRVDALSTRRTAWQVVWGTAVGATLGTAVVVAANSWQLPWLLWLLLPVASLLLGWAPTAFASVAISQISFSTMVLIAFAIIQWPADLMLGLTRIENMSLGAGVAIVCALLLWPHGVMGFLRDRVAASVAASATCVHDAVGAFLGEIPSERARQRLVPARRALLYSAEAIDLALVQRGNGDGLMPWLRVEDVSGAMVHVGRMFLHMVGDQRHSPDAQLVSGLRGARNSAAVTWRALEDECRRPSQSPAVTTARPVHLCIDTIPTTHEGAETLCLAVWGVDYLNVLTRLNSQAESAISAAATQSR